MCFRGDAITPDDFKMNKLNHKNRKPSAEILARETSGDF